MCPRGDGDPDRLADSDCDVRCPTKYRSVAESEVGYSLLTYYSLTQLMWCQRASESLEPAPSTPSKSAAPTSYRPAP